MSLGVTADLEFACHQQVSGLFSYSLKVNWQSLFLPPFSVEVSP